MPSVRCVRRGITQSVCAPWGSASMATPPLVPLMPWRSRATGVQSTDPFSHDSRPGLSITFSVISEHGGWIDVKSKPDISSIPDIMDTIYAVEKELGDQGRVLVRYSGTQPMCRVMVEGPTHEDTERYCKKIAEVVRSKLN